MVRDWWDEDGKVVLHKKMTEKKSNSLTELRKSVKREYHIALMNENKDHLTKSNFFVYRLVHASESNKHGNS